MRGAVPLRTGVLLALMALFGIGAVRATPEGGHAVGIWPVGVATALLLVTTRPRLAVLAAATAVVAFGSITVGGRPPEVAAGFAVALTVEALVVWRLLTGGRRTRPPLRSAPDLGRLLLATGAGAAVAALGAAGLSLVLGWGSPWTLALSVGASGMASHLVLLPFFCDLRRSEAVAALLERVAQWALVVVVPTAVFAVDDLAASVFLVVPVLVWGGLRSGALESLAQLVVTTVLVVQLTTDGSGPFAAAAEIAGLPTDTRGVLLAMFVAICAVVVLALVVSVGEQRALTRAAAAERDRLQNIVDGTLGVAIIGSDAAGHITLFNPGAERLLGYDAADVLGRPTRHLHTEAAVSEKARDLGVDDDYLTVVAAMAGHGPMPLSLLHRDGTERRHMITLNPVVDDVGHVVGYVSTSEDITERLAAENHLREALATERRATERLRDVDAAKDAFVSNVSHELRTPITSILGYTELLADGMYGELEPQQGDAVRRVRANSARLLAVIGDLLTLARLQEDGVHLADDDLDLREVVSSGVGVVVSTLDGRDLVVETDLPREPVALRGDPEMLERVVINLVGNAAKFTPDGGRVDVRLVEVDGHVELAVADTGIGIAEHEQGRLFSRFFRSSEAQQRAIPGTGLGLAITRTIVERHGGTVALESAAGVGTTITVLLPSRERHRPGAAAPPGPSGSAVPPAARGSSTRGTLPEPRAR